jgi:hypothetical protein
VRLAVVGDTDPSNQTMKAVEWSLVIALLIAALQLVRIPPSNRYIFHLLVGLVGTALSFGRLVRPIWQATEGDAA